MYVLYACARGRMCACVCVCFICVCVSVCAYICVCVCACIHTFVHTYRHSNIHTYTHRLDAWASATCICQWMWWMTRTSQSWKKRRACITVWFAPPARYVMCLHSVCLHTSVLCVCIHQLMDNCMCTYTLFSFAVFMACMVSMYLYVCMYTYT